VELPPKTCSVERLVTRTEDVQKVLSGIKTATRRGGRYADPGELWTLQGVQFRVTSVYPQKLGDMNDADARREGFSTVDQYMGYLNGVHPGSGFSPAMGMWVHDFERVAETSPSTSTDSRQSLTARPS